jgi:hypothetical protein
LRGILITEGQTRGKTDFGREKEGRLEERNQKRLESRRVRIFENGYAKISKIGGDINGNGGGVLVRREPQWLPLLMFCCWTY